MEPSSGAASPSRFHTAVIKQTDTTGLLKCLLLLVQSKERCSRGAQSTAKVWGFLCVKIKKSRERERSRGVLGHDCQPVIALFFREYFANQFMLPQVSVSSCVML